MFLYPVQYHFWDEYVFCSVVAKRREGKNKMGFVYRRDFGKVKVNDGMEIRERRK